MTQRSVSSEKLAILSSSSIIEETITPTTPTHNQEKRRTRRSAVSSATTAIQSDDDFFDEENKDIYHSLFVDSDTTSDNNQNENANNILDDSNDYDNDHDKKKQKYTTMWGTISQYMNSTRLMVLLVLCLQNSLFTVLRRYSQGVLQELYSKHELLLVAEVIKIVYSSWMISEGLPEGKSLSQQLMYLVQTSRKMFVLAMIYGAMNILSFVSLRNISAGMFTIFAQCKILTTATFSTIILRRRYSWTKWRALIALMLGVLLFSEPIWGDPSKQVVTTHGANQVLGTVAVLVEVTLSGFASIYFEKVIKTDPLKLGIWERNFQLALGSFPVYMMFIVAGGGGEAGFFGGWSPLAFLLSGLGAAGGLLVALSIKYGDSILKTLATTGAIVLTGVLDHYLLGGPLTPSMMIAGVQVIIAICNYSFDATPEPAMVSPPKAPQETEIKSTRNVEEGLDGAQTEQLLHRRDHSFDSVDDKTSGSPSKRDKV
jgi:UDP-sugar transporter A1/2/3